MQSILHTCAFTRAAGETDIIDGLDLNIDMAVNECRLVSIGRSGCVL